MNPMLIFDYLPLINRCLLPTQASQSEMLVGLCPHYLSELLQRIIGSK